MPCVKTSAEKLQLTDIVLVILRLVVMVDRRGISIIVGSTQFAWIDSAFLPYAFFSKQLFRTMYLDFSFLFLLEVIVVDYRKELQGRCDRLRGPGSKILYK